MARMGYGGRCPGAEKPSRSKSLRHPPTRRRHLQQANRSAKLIPKLCTARNSEGLTPTRPGASYSTITRAGGFAAWTVRGQNPAVCMRAAESQRAQYSRDDPCVVGSFQSWCSNPFSINRSCLRSLPTDPKAISESFSLSPGDRRSGLIGPGRTRSRPPTATGRKGTTRRPLPESCR